MIHSDSFTILKRIDGTFYIYKQGNDTAKEFKSLEEVFKFMKKWNKYIDKVIHPKMLEDERKRREG